MNFIGIDGCKAGWFYFLITEDSNYKCGVLKTISESLKLFDKNDKILIDIPVGLRTIDTKERLCDLEARKILGDRKSSVFPVPSRLSLVADTYEEASKINFVNCGRKLSKQTWAIAPKIKEVDEFILNFNPEFSIREMHPECCFWGLNNKQPMKFNKKDPEGYIERKELLNKFFPQTKKAVDEIRRNFKQSQVSYDDILDAMAGAVTLKYSKKLNTLPNLPEIDSKELRMEIIYPEIL